MQFAPEIGVVSTMKTQIHPRERQRGRVGGSGELRCSSSDGTSLQFRLEKSIGRKLAAKLHLIGPVISSAKMPADGTISDIRSWFLPQSPIIPAHVHRNLRFGPLARTSYASRVIDTTNLPSETAPAPIARFQWPHPEKRDSRNSVNVCSTRHWFPEAAPLCRASVTRERPDGSSQVLRILGLRDRRP